MNYENYILSKVLRGREITISLAFLEKEIPSEIPSLKVIEDWAKKICREYGIRAIIYAASDVITFFPCRQYPGATVQAWGEI